MRPRHYDRFVLIGLCWLYGRSEFPPPPPFFPESLSVKGDVLIDFMTPSTSSTAYLEPMIKEEHAENQYFHTARKS